MATDEPGLTERRLARCGFCGAPKMASTGTTSHYICGASVGCAHQNEGPACKYIVSMIHPAQIGDLLDHYDRGSIDAAILVANLKSLISDK